MKKQLNSNLNTHYVNTEIDLVQLAIYMGYVNISTDKKSVNSITLKNNSGDCVIINTSTQWYFNPNDDGDRGKAFKFILNRINSRLENISNATGIEKYKTFKIAGNFLNLPLEEKTKIEAKSSKIKKKIGNQTKQVPSDMLTLSKKLGISPLTKRIFLTKTRKISNTTIDHPIFKNKIFNSFVIYKGNALPNVAFPKFNPETKKITGYEIRNNNNFKSSQGNNNHLWHSVYPKIIKHVAIVESAIDALSHFELFPNDNLHTLYVSLAGNISDKKRESLTKLLSPILREHPKAGIKLLTDNDVSGSNYDLKIITDIINSYSKAFYIEEHQEKEFFKMHIHHKNDSILETEEKYLSLKTTIDTFNDIHKDAIKSAKIFQRKNVIDLEIPKYIDIKNKLPTKVKGVLQKIISQYSNVPIKFEKAVLNDWNDDLKKK